MMTRIFRCFVPCWEMKDNRLQTDEKGHLYQPSPNAPVVQWVGDAKSYLAEA